jgi:hypothetical protein
MRKRKRKLPSNVVDFAEWVDAKEGERIWGYICQVCAKYAGISTQEAANILVSVGMDATGHRGIVPAINEVMWAARPDIYDEVMTKLTAESHEL